MFGPELEIPFMVYIPIPEVEFGVTLGMCIGESKGKLHFVLLSEDGL